MSAPFFFSRFFGRTIRWWWAGFGMLMLVTACRVYVKRTPPPFPHTRHSLLSCKRCHASNAHGQMQMTARLKQCTFCHTEAPQHRPKWLVLISQRQPHPKTTTEQPLIFSHLKHAKRVKGYGSSKGCGTCHGTVTAKKGGHRTPTMASCLSCHVHKKDFDEMNCKRCHTDLRRFQLKPLSDYHHGPNFTRNHKRFAKGRLDLCVTCHDQPFCARCHDPKQPGKPSLQFPTEVTKGFIHRGDFVSRHGVQARLNPSQCSRCHGVSTCVGCHQTAQRKILRGNLSPHPAGYVRRGGKAFHGRDARRDPSRCQSCHSQGAKSNCVTCHKVGGVGGNPHPPGWRFNKSRFEKRTNGMCRTCHGVSQ